MSSSVPGPSDPVPAPRRATRVSWTRIVIAVAVIVAIAYAYAHSGFRSHGPIAKWYLSEMKIDLMDLRKAEESFRSDSARYTRDVGSRFVLNPTLNPPTITAANSAWSATITSKRLPGAVCGIAVGVPNPVGASVKEGEPVCALPATGLPKGR